MNILTMDFVLDTFVKYYNVECWTFSRWEKINQARFSGLEASTETKPTRGQSEMSLCVRLTLQHSPFVKF